MVECIDRNRGESCPGEAECAETGGPLAKYADADTEQICSGCPLYDSKPSRMPEHIAPFAARAFELERFKACGAAFQYPDGLTHWEWAVIAAASSGRDKAEQTRRKAEERKRR